ncbi:MAG: DUF1080 domain-containing protein [Prosthecobacter sp.]
MKLLHIYTLILLATFGQAAVEPGFEDLLNGDNAAYWKQCGPGKMALSGGETLNSSSSEVGVAWFTKREFADFVLKVEFRGAADEFNSGVRLRLPKLGNDPALANQLGYEVAIHHTAKRYKWETGSIHGVKASTSQALKPLDWNAYEITVTGQEYSVMLNGRLVNRFTGNRALSGYIGLEQNPTGPVKFRNLRIRDLTSPAASLSAAPLASIQTDASQPRIEVIKDQGPNATEWALTPLDEAIPADIRQNLTFLREDLLDEGKKAAKASPEAYKLASEYCDKILTALDQRDLARVNAGYAAAQADANKATSTQALDARRNYQMSWPQYAREESQRAALRENESGKADVKKQRLKVEWMQRAVQMRTYLDELYRQLREAMR